MPLLMLGLGAAPTLMMLYGGKGDTKRVVVVDDTADKFVSQALHSTSSVEFQALDGISKADAIKTFSKESDAYAILYVGADILNNPSDIQLIWNGSAAVATEEEIGSQVNAALREAKLKTYDIEGLDEIIAQANIRANIQTLKNNGETEESMEKTSTDFAYILSLILGMILYMFILIYGQQVLSTVIEEKQSRVLDVMVTSVKPYDLMMGKILGIGAVAAIQIAIWAVLIVGISKFVMPLVMPEGIMETAGGMLQAMFRTIGNPAYMAKLFLYLFLFMATGFMFYASLYAAIGSSVDTPQDAQQFNSILMIPIVISIVIMMQVFNDPNSGLVFWCSMIPFTSPMVMMARIPFDIPSWQIFVSLAILVLFFLFSVWISARIFRIGIFMHGKKPTWKDLGQWIKM